MLYPVDATVSAADVKDTHVIVAVGSQNPVKIAATRQAFGCLWPDQPVNVVGVAVVSGVAAQPMSDAESVAGARRRAHLARQALDADFGAGLEGGLQETDGWWFDCGWVVVTDRAGREGIGATLKMAVPPRLLALIRRGMELGEAIDEVFGTQNAKQAQGHFGLMTNNAVTRTEAYTHGVISALARFTHGELFDNV